MILKFYLYVYIGSSASDNIWYCGVIYRHQTLNVRVSCKLGYWETLSGINIFSKVCQKIFYIIRTYRKMQLYIPALSFDFLCYSLHLTDLKNFWILIPNIFLWKSNLVVVSSFYFNCKDNAWYITIYSYARLGKHCQVYWLIHCFIP